MRQTERYEVFTADDHSSQESNLCLGTVKSARTSFLLFDLVFMFMQKSIAAYMKDTNIRVCSNKLSHQKTSSFPFSFYQVDYQNQFLPCL